MEYATDGSVFNMMMCSICKENIAVVFITKIIDGKQTQEGMCISCAKKNGVQPINQILEQTGISDDEIDDLSKQMGEFIQDMNIEDFGNMSEDFVNTTNPFLNIFNKNLFRKESTKNSKNDEINEQKDREKDFKNNKKIKTQEKKASKRKKYLDTYGDNLTEKARNNKIDRVI